MHRETKGTRTIFKKRYRSGSASLIEDPAHTGIDTASKVPSYAAQAVRLLGARQANRQEKGVVAPSYTAHSGL